MRARLHGVAESCISSALSTYFSRLDVVFVLRALSINNILVTYYEGAVRRKWGVLLFVKVWYFAQLPYLRKLTHDFWTLSFGGFRAVVILYNLDGASLY